MAEQERRSDRALVLSSQTPLGLLPAPRRQTLFALSNAGSEKVELTANFSPCRPWALRLGLGLALLLTPCKGGGRNALGIGE